MAPTPPRSITELFLGFLSIGARAFGGVLPWAHRALVEERRWLAPADFSEMLALCQFLPGPNVANLSIVLGRRWFGLPGAFAGFLGLMALPFVCVLGLAMLYAEWATNPTVRAVVSGIGVAAAGLFIGTGIKLARPIAAKPAAIAIIAGCFVAAGMLRVPLLIVLPVATALALIASRMRAL
ncbi:MAG TPA: chromate transporter [Burkholderiales bacterium]|nr:chromate transporter [Burkholderiales bacterium]